MKSIYLLVVFCFASFYVFGGDTDYEDRKEDYIETELASGGNNKIIQAYQGIPLNAIQLESTLNELATNKTADFRIVELIRVLFFTEGEYDDQILSTLDTIPFWVNYEDTIRNYWTENHMIMWSSSNWLLHERYDRPIDATLHDRLVHYLQLKIDYGFYEFFSSTYLTYTLSGLLNLADFSEDVVIKDLATQAAQKLLTYLLIPTTDIGVYFPSAGRNYLEKYKNAYHQNHNSLIYLLTGFGEIPTGASHSGAFLSTSDLPVDDVMSTWLPQLDTIIDLGHSFEETSSIHSSMIDLDRIIFQWTAGIYTHPDVAQESTQLLVDSNLWNHPDYTFLQPLSSVPPENASELAEQFSVISKSSVNTGHQSYIFKNNSIALCSVHDFWKGKVGYQQYPCVATIGKTATFISSGEVFEDWSDRDRTIQNTHLPYVEQSHNVALIMYRPEPIPPLLEILTDDLFTNKDVALFWEEEEYDEIVMDGLWLIGRQEDNYVAVKRSCEEEINSWYACETIGGQTWVMIVGNVDMYSSFGNFQDLIAESEFTEEWYYDPGAGQSIYYAEIDFDTISIDYTWGVDSLISAIQDPIVENNRINLYPNPTNEMTWLDLSSFLNQSISIKVVNFNGREMYLEHIGNLDTERRSINTSGWPAGIYYVIVGNKEHRVTSKLTRLK